ncbi:MAG: hypothetical protein OEY41_09835, partial [Acidimicrobiia bacterium]|nr:hypothetical protein [Acidimicrobiia bacterium]
GATTPGEAARAASDPELLARVEVLGQVRAALGAIPPVDVERREHAIAAALAAFDEQGALSAPTLRAGAPISRRRRRPAPRTWRLVGVAAALAALVAVVPIVASLSSRSDDPDATALSGPEERSADRSTGPSSAAPDDAEAGAALGPTSSSAAPNAARYPALGAFADDDALVQGVRSAPGPVDSGGAPYDLAPDPTSCVARLVEGLPRGATPILAATASVAGAPVAVVVTLDEVRIVGGDCTDVRIRER